MKQLHSLGIYTIAIIVLLSSCAAPYRAIKPNHLNFNAHNKSENIDFSYKYDVLLERNNKRYSKKERKKGIRLVAVKLTNNSNKEIVVKDDLIFTANSQQVFPLEPTVLKQSIKQYPATYLLYLLLTPLSFNTYDQYGNVESTIPFGLILGPGLAIGNLVGSSSANKNMVGEYSKELIINKTVGPGETITGLMAIKTTGFPTLSVLESNRKSN